MCNVPAVILAGGMGKRLGSLTAETPKPLIRVANSPIIVRQLAELRLAGVNTILVSTGYRAELLMEELLDGSNFGVDIYYSHEDTPLGRGGGIKKALSGIGGNWEYAIVRNGDNLTFNLDFENLLEFHKKNNALVTAVVARRSAAESLGYGLIETDENLRIKSFKEKPKSIEGDSSVLINAGIYIISRKVVGLFPDIGDHEVGLFPSLASDGNLYGYPIEEWLTVDTPEDLERAEDIIKRK